MKCCGNEVLETIIPKVQKAQFFAVIFDETTDIANMLQMSIVIRYVHEKVIREDFLNFMDLYDYARTDRNKIDYSKKSHNIEENLTGKTLGGSVIAIL